MTTSDTARATPDADACGDLPVENGEFVRQTLGRVGDRWSLLVIARLQDGPRRYGDLHHAVEGISQRMLTLTLRQLAEDGLVTRAAYAEVPPRVEYSLTPLGESLLDAATTLIRWVSDHHADIRAHRRRGAVP
ncbi:DNA-binding HxlR family transcriptional regulator [Catenuloplanes nepalensis]|uniref:DNA-binding HxlR family transcriptional regulator n=1 Tax=Catenuloplanes nepalensis TaxID=587533 RepID=A0ABT9MP80_9ACTN|nr:helix-turn-helix domain-containing protein [Catenuloplanes nepalensis]MDP9793212.1 DNA-binding HxlR family transcriptional regulator [Catenuloplanes nepalensis]